MGQIIFKVLASMLSSYIAKLATKEFFDYVLWEVIEAGVKSTKTTVDDKWAEKIKEITR